MQLTDTQLDLVAERLEHEITRDALQGTQAQLTAARNDLARVYMALDNAISRNRQANGSWFCVGFVACGIAVAVLFVSVRLSQ